MSARLFSTRTRRSERIRAFQVIYSLFFSPAHSCKELASRYARTLYTETPPPAVPPESSAAKEERASVPDEAAAEPREEIRVLIPDASTGKAEGFAWELVLGVWREQAELDGLIARFSQNWKIERMGRVELALLRLALHELVFCADTPPKVVINEAVEISRLFGDDASRGFVNGILDAAVKAAESGPPHHTACQPPGKAGRPAGGGC
ncbi:MAG: transcription antitermination factor NusB [Deltaproteobacteria bacterium]|jgi:N utilization substance protein B|nr:transcription antitermination factor NusB [Deltaproteobacteria bacterium]